MKTELKVRLLAHTQLSSEYIKHLMIEDTPFRFTDGEAVALTAIRTCYSHLDPWDIVRTEGHKYFEQEATDGLGGRESDRLFRTITHSGHTSTLEHINFVFAIHGVTRSLLAQLTRHRVGMSFSVQSQRYVRFGTNNKSGGFRYIIPPKVEEKGETAIKLYEDIMHETQSWYDMLCDIGVSPEDARMVLPNAASVNLVMSANLTALMTFYGKRRKGNGAQWEIAEFAETLRSKVVEVEPWTDQYFERAWYGKKR